MILFDLEQEGSKVKGSVLVKGSGARRSGLAVSEAREPVEGTVAGDLFTFREQNWPLESQLTVSGDEMTGRASMAQGIIRLSLRRVQSLLFPKSAAPLSQSPHVPPSLALGSQTVSGKTQ